jgi:FLVCR family MFS transporter 7
MTETGPSYKVYRSRWLNLALLIPVIVASEIFWLTFAPIETIAKEFYNTSSFNISLFSLSYMVMYILFTMPASYVIEKYGYKRSVAIGVVLTVVFGATRYFFAENFIIVLVSQFLLAAGQPFLVNISTKVPANWFPVNERSTASGLLVMAQYLGFIIAMILSTVLIDVLGIKNLLGVYALFALISGVPALFAKEKPPAAPGPEAPKESMDLRGMLGLFRNRRFLPVLTVSFISMGLFNTLMTKVDQIFSPKGADAGLIGAIFVISGIIGAVALPMISDRLRVRVPFFITGVALIALLLAGIAFLAGATVLVVISIILGFVVMGMAPILFQHGAEVAYPVQEGASFGSIMMMGQISGILFVVLFEVIQEASPGLWPLLFLLILAVLQIPVAAVMKESQMIKQGEDSSRPTLDA